MSSTNAGAEMALRLQLQVFDLLDDSPILLCRVSDQPWRDGPHFACG